VLVGTGSEQQRFKVHHRIITKHSEFFCTARSERGTSNTKSVDLPEQDPSIFALYMDRLYDETMPKTPVLAKSAYFSSKFVDVNAYREHNQKLYTANIILTDAHWKTLIGLYVLACYLLDPAAKNMAIDQIRRFYYEMSWDCSLEKEIINLVLRSTPHGDALRNLFADFYVFDGEDSFEDLPKEWFVLLWLRSLSLREFDRLAVEEDELVRFRKDIGWEHWENFEYYSYVEEEEQEE
jgi:hypothetical protein